MPMPFAKANWISELEKDSVKRLIVERIDLVYTDYQESQRFSQSQLNRQRLQAFMATLPEIWNNPLIEWNLIAQSAGTDAASAKGLFHGFAITYRLPPTVESTEKELAYLRSFKNALLGMEDEGPPNLSVVGGSSVYYDTVITGIKQRWDDKIGYVHDTTFEVRALAYKPRKAMPSSDSALFIALIQEGMGWSNVALVCDVTGSMSPYSAQLLEWMRYYGKTNKVNYYLFFNDGNRKPTLRKRIGNTGGLYGTSETGLNPVFETMTKAMSRGSGGDGPENDVEALLKAAEEYPACEHLILIADNDAPMRDLILYKELKLPVHVFVCGTKRGINPQYLELARNTGGSLHTGEEIFSELHLLREGDRIRVGSNDYYLHENRFIRKY